MLGQSFWIDLNLQHLDALPPYGHIGHTRYAQQTLSNLPVGDHRKIHD